MRNIPKLTNLAKPLPDLRPVFLWGLFTIGLSVLPAHLTFAQTHSTPYTYSLYGTPGLIDMPTAQSAEDGELAMTVSTFKGQARTTLSFQITPRLSGSFRYSTIDNFDLLGERTWDRSFDLRYRLIDEGRYRPAVAIGLQDFMGTGIYGGEYIVATKAIGNKLTVTGGLGWGRLGSNNGFTNPLGAISGKFETRPGWTGLGGEPSFKQWFRGDAAFFGGISYALNDRLTFKAEYSSDAYTAETSQGLPADRFVHRSPLNFGINYRVRPGINLSAAYLYGSVLSVGANFVLNPRHAPTGGSLARAPIPVKPRPARHISPQDWGTGWVQDAPRTAAIHNALSQVLVAEGMELVSIKLSGNSVRVQIRNLRYSATPQAIGRTARILTQVMPASVEVFRIEPVIEGIAPAAITLQRSDIEALENTAGGTALLYSRAQISTVAPSDNMPPVDDLYPRLKWGLGPYLGASLFDPDSPVILDAGVELTARYDIAPGFSFSGEIRQPLLGTNSTNRVSDSVIQHVRSDITQYTSADGPLLSRLTMDYYFRPGRNVYGHVSAGYLEQMYGGVSGEILWKPIDSRLGLGVELNYVKQRDFDQRFGFQNYDTVTGHASAYYDFGNGFHGQLDVGRYLAKDWGTTVSLDREFKNGWKVGAYFTLTDVSFDDFGEGSFDKGIRLTIPVSWATGQSTRRTINANIRSLTRDGGARLNVEGRLYNIVREFHDPALQNRWGRFWR